MSFFSRNKRKYPRIKSIAVAKVDRLESSQESSNEIGEFSLIDLSEGGLQFSSDEVFKTTEWIRVTVCLIGTKKTVEVTARVSRINSVKTGSGKELYHVGAIFSDMPDRDREFLSKYISNSKKKK